MSNVKEATKIGFAYVGVVVGAGFSTGQEVMKFFTHYGLYGYIGVIISGIMLAFFGRQVAKIGTALDANEHSSTINYLFGKYGIIIDYVLTFFLFGISVTMIAGAGSAFEESFSIPTWLGALLMCIVIYITLLLDFDKIVKALGIVTPFLIVIILIIAGYFFVNGHVSIAETNNAVENPSLVWGIIQGFVYGGLAFSVGFSTLVAIGGDADKRRISGLGGIIGGVIYLVLLALINSGLLAEYPNIKNVEIPTLALARTISPIIGVALSIIMLMVMYNTILGLMYSFTARFTVPFSKKYIILLTIAMAAAYGLSFVGFSSLIDKLYPAMGVIGLVICAAILVKYINRKKENEKHIA
ncbi:hypothetical protein [Mammaliicoccus stepanovicii]|uniref:Branched-chain amino acid transport system II carrier protein n=1 Tax=Mammaliicoccus stepanovicii TaxID=643214 RepID=A0A239YIF8_9STAP|nr:hypothetical protein [Mammaliicoccus stepanovicii]PNZ75713.1 hypothetical protein CD111_06815 [Mammaliicoccus stepanovicii]GGI40753.1 membrane protein [Mammaliicoccus stepanovicii]SNV57974.1 branched-chain amino acid transport system II carrier protein [Mammaliicoccus stepanovicii]